MAAIPFDAFCDAFQVIQRVADEREERGSEDRFRIGYDLDVVVNDPLAEDVAAHERQNGHDAEHDCNAVRCDLRQIRARFFRIHVKFSPSCGSVMIRALHRSPTSPICCIVRKKPCGATAGVRFVPGREGGKTGLPSRGSCLFAYSLPLSDDLTDRGEAGVLVLEVGAYEMDVSLCHVRRRVTEKRLYREGVCSGPKKERCGGVSESVRRDRLPETESVKRMEALSPCRFKHLCAVPRAEYRGRRFP